MKCSRFALSPLAVALASILFLPATANAAAVETPNAANATDLETVEVIGERADDDGYAAKRTRTATKTDTDLVDVPQSITIVTRELIEDQAMQGMADAVQYVPGIGMAQGEGNRDTPVLRGNSSTADFFLDGVRDDVQYFRDVYNIERIEALKGPNAMIFGRGGSGGIINRVSKVADGSEHGQVSLQLGSWNRNRLTADVGNVISDAASFRIAGLYEDSESYRDGVGYRRVGVNPSLSFELGEATDLTLAYEHFEDERTADRGVPSFQGRPLATDASTFFGNAELSTSDGRVDSVSLVLDHDFSERVHLRNSLRWADYDKFYQNVFPGAVNAAGTMVSISAYNNDTQRRNLFNQTDLTVDFDTGRIRHTLLAGLELGRQETANFRNTGYFTSISASTTSAQVSVVNPVMNLPIEFRQSASDADNEGVATISALYLQDQIEFSPRWQAILGLRYDRFEVDFRNNRSGLNFNTVDNLLSPRIGLVFKPEENLSLYLSKSLAYVPRAGEQLASLSLSNQALEPEEFDNLEIGAKWQVNPDLLATLAVYRSDRGNVAVSEVDASTGQAITVLVDAQRVEGVELGLAGKFTENWSVMAGYAYQDGRITRNQSATALAGNILPQLPRHSASLWNRYDLSERWGLGLGAIHRGEIYASTDNTVVLPGYTRFDAAIYCEVNESVGLQLNIENVFNRSYYATAHSNNNITPGAPRAAWLSLNLKF